jgi:hypothetical protein
VSQPRTNFRNAYIIAGSAAMGSIFYGWDMYVSLPSTNCQSQVGADSKRFMCSGLIGGILALDSFKQYFGLDKMTAAQRADLNGNIVSVLQAGCLCASLPNVV